MAIFDQKDITCIICGEHTKRNVTAKIEVCGEYCRNKYYQRLKNVN